jgi:hypothetical protein
VVLAPLFIGGTTLAFLFWLKRAAQKQRQRQSGLELKVPPMALGLIAAALMWCARSATPDFDFLFPSNPVFSVGLALAGVLTCLAGVVSFRQAKTTVNPMKPDSTCDSDSKNCPLASSADSIRLKRRRKFGISDGRAVDLLIGSVRCGQP